MTPEQQRTEAAEKQKRIIKQWREFANGYGRDAFQDLLDYSDDLRKMYIQYAEERTMPHPNGSGSVPIDSETVNSLLQNSRGVNIMRTYILSRVNAEDVVQPKKTK